jgi:DNA-binding NarL/FixJ family response regulator
METQDADTIVGSEPQTLPRSNLQHPGPTVFIVSDVRLLREGLALSLSRQSLAVADAAGLTISPTDIAAARPDVVLLDVGTPGSLAALLALRHALPDLKIVAIAVSDIKQEVVACAEAGVSGFVSRDGSIQDLVTAVHCAMRNEFLCSPRIAALLFSRAAANGSERKPCPRQQRADAARARDRLADDAGPFQQGDRAPAAHPERNGQESYSQHPRQAAGATPRRGRRTHERERFAEQRRSVSAVSSSVSARRNCFPFVLFL